MLDAGYSMLDKRYKNIRYQCFRPKAGLKGGIGYWFYQYPVSSLGQKNIINFFSRIKPHGNSTFVI